MDDSTAEKHLADLAQELDPAVFRTKLIRSAGDWPELTITNRTAARLTERVKISDGHYMWSWGQVIAPVTEPALAARRVSMVLAVVGG